MIELGNSFLKIAIDEQNNANIVSMLASGGDGFNILDKRGLCTWLKKGTVKDLSTKVLSNFYGTLFIEPVSLDEKNSDSAVFSRTVDGLKITKRISLHGNKVKVGFSIKNNSDKETQQLQIEHFNMFAGGRLPLREGMFTSVLEGAEVVDFMECTCFGERYVKSFDYNRTSIVVGSTKKNYCLKLSSDNDCEAATAMIHGNTVTRGFNSLKFKLKPGEEFSHGMIFEFTVGRVPEEYVTGKCIKPKARISRQQALENIVSVLKGEPMFRNRWSHLCLQYDRTEPADVMKVISDILVPLRYTGVIFEFDRGLRTVSHPELAEPWSWSMETARNIVDFARKNGLRTGVEFNVPGHQNETGIEKAHPELLECGKLAGRTSTLCVSNPDARKIVRDIFDEYQKAFQPDLIFLAADEVQFDGCGCSFGLCPLCKGKDPSTLFGEYLDWLMQLVKSPDTDIVIAGDMFLQSEQFGPAISGNGSAGDVWKTIDRLSKRYHIADWHYYPAEEYKSLDFFIGKGFKVMPVTAFHFDALRMFLSDAEKRNIKTALHTTWAVPNQEKLPIESMIWGGIYHWLGSKADNLPVKELATEYCRRFW